jgi:hypothetical protein
VNQDLLGQAASALAMEADAAPVPATTRAAVLARVRRANGHRFRSAAAVAAGLFLSATAALATVDRPAALRAWRIVIERITPGRTQGVPGTAGGPSHPAVTPSPVKPRSWASAGPVPARGRPLALFQRAQDLHFHQHDPAGALAAWDAYLLAFPAGTLAPEARYNRALCLVRLGRNGEARAALAPLASGQIAFYRQQEARALLRSLSGLVPGDPP